MATQFQSGGTLAPMSNARIVADVGGAQLSVFPTAVGTFTATGATPVTVAASGVTASSQVIFTLKTVGGTVGAYPTVATITVGTGFTVTATAGDTSVYNWLVWG